MFGSIFFDKFKRIFSTAAWVVSFFSIVLAGVVAISQNSVPGDFAYQIKTGFEKVVLYAYKIAHKDTDYQINLTELRFDESKKLIKSDRAVDSLNNLNLQILDTENSIKKINDQASKTTYTNLYISTLKDINNQLEAQKSINVSLQTDNTLLQNTTPSQSEVINNQINQTQEQIQETITTLAQDSSGAPQPNPTSSIEQQINPTQAPSAEPSEKEKHDKDKNEKEKDKTNNGNNNHQ